MAQELVMNDLELKVLTPTGYKRFSGISKTLHEHVVEIKTSTRTIVAGLTHKFLVEDGWVLSKDLAVGMTLTTEKMENDPITSVVVLNEPQFMYDLLDVEGGKSYLVNGVVSHNCEFLSSDALLINSIKLSQLRDKVPHHEDMGFRFWKPDEEVGGQGKTYLVGVDPATGNGKDYSVIQVFDFPNLEQIAEWRSNEINIPLLYAKLKWMLERLSAPVGRGRSEVLWTFERNGIGEALSALYQNDEKQPEHAELFNDDQTGRKLGVFTSGKSKILACLQLKNLVEKITNGLRINSSVLLEELKNFVAKGGTYEAKAGSSDDAVMATVIMIRLLKRLSEYNEVAFQQVNEYVEPDVDDQYGDEPIPFF